MTISFFFLPGTRHPDVEAETLATYRFTLLQGQNITNGNASINCRLDHMGYLELVFYISKQPRWHFRVFQSTSGPARLLAFYLPEAS